MSIFDEPKIDCHNHVFDPVRFPFADTPYLPSGPELGDARLLTDVFDAYGVADAVLVGPNSGYGADSSCLLDALEAGDGRYRGMAVVAPGTDRETLRRLRKAGVLGITVNATAGDYGDERVLAELAGLGMFADIQGEADQLVTLIPPVERSGATILVDHCGRPDPRAGLDQPGFQAVLRLARTGRAYVKLSGHAKFSHEPYPHRDTWPFVHALLEAYGTRGCLWGSDWPFLRAERRIDYGLLLRLVEHLIPDAADRRDVLWETPRALFGFGR